MKWVRMENLPTQAIRSATKKTKRFIFFCKFLLSFRIQQLKKFEVMIKLKYVVIVIQGNLVEFQMRRIFEWRVDCGWFWIVTQFHKIREMTRSWRHSIGSDFGLAFPFLTHTSCFCDVYVVCIGCEVELDGISVDFERRLHSSNDISRDWSWRRACRVCGNNICIATNLSGVFCFSNIDGFSPFERCDNAFNDNSGVA